MKRLGERRKCGDFLEGGGFEGLCSNPQKIQSERAEGVDLPEEEGGGEVEGDVWKRKSKSLFTVV